MLFYYRQLVKKNAKYEVILVFKFFFLVLFFCIGGKDGICSWLFLCCIFWYKFLVFFFGPYFDVNHEDSESILLFFLGFLRIYGLCAFNQYQQRTNSTWTELHAKLNRMYMSPLIS